MILVGNKGEGFGLDTAEDGLVVSSCNQGSVCLWDVNKLLELNNSRKNMQIVKSFVDNNWDEEEDEEEPEDKEEEQNKDNKI